MNPIWRGCFTALVTPFSESTKEVDYDSLSRLVDYQIASGVHGLVVCGSTGEAATLREDEYFEVVRHVLRCASSAASFGRGKTVPCIAGIGVSSTERGVEIAAKLSALNEQSTRLAGLLVSAPQYNKPSQAGIIQHVKLIGDSAKLPVVLYNIPGRSAVNIAPSTVAQLFEGGNIVAIKEASGNMDQVLDILAATKLKLAVLSGEDSLVAAVMACGGKGVISAVANAAPKSFVALVEAAERGDYSRAREVQLGLLPLIRCCFAETNPVPVKAALHLKGIISSKSVRLPLISASAETESRLRQLESSEFFG